MTDLPRKKLDRRFCVAPMMEWTDKHCRYLMRLLSRNAVLYTEMVTTGALLFGDQQRFLSFNQEEHPVALQLGGSDPEALAQCANIADNWGYDEVNLNCGCPSDRVQNGMIGAILMAHPERVRDCIQAMQASCSIPVTVKHRIGIDDMEDFDGLCHFVDHIAAVGCKTFIVHARKAWLQGLSPKENREIPPLNYELVHRLKKTFPDVEIIINGGIKTIEACQSQLEAVDGVMVGREAYHNPYMLSEVDGSIYQAGSEEPVSREQVLREYIAYCDRILDTPTPENSRTRLHHLTKPLLGLFQGMPGGRKFRSVISQKAHLKTSTTQVIWEAYDEVIKANSYRLSGFASNE